MPAKSWLYDSNLKDDAKILEQSVYLPFYTSVLSLLYLREQVERRSDLDEEDESELDPNEFTVYRQKWPRKK